MDKRSIEQRALAVIDRVRRTRSAALGRDGSELTLCDPVLAAAACGYRVLVEDALAPGIAGELDRDTRTITVSPAWRLPERRFTIAHEVGHLMLGHPGITLHRDRPYDRGRDRHQPRPPQEAEADYFAACLTMPDYLVEDVFTRIFGPTRPYRVGEALAYHLNPRHPDWAQSAGPAEVAIAIARFRHHPAVPASIADRFQVSATSMGIRLLELGIVR